MSGNQYFLLPPQPDPKDRRKRNAFGYLIGFGKAASAYYLKRDRQAAKAKAKAMAKKKKTKRKAN
jgi:hypothetical protein